MKMRATRVWAAVLVVMAGLACGGSVSAQSTQQKKKEPPKKSSHHKKHATKHKKKTLHNGSSVERGPNGHVADVHNEQRHMDIHHGVAGDRRVSVERADHSRVVAMHGRPGYIERPYAWHGHDFYTRHYYWHGHVYTHYYRGWYWHGVGLRVYAPYHYWPIGFYGWAWHPWRVHVTYAWGWGGAPWYGYYGYYYRPYPYYVGAGPWIVDNMMAHDLQQAYDAGRAQGYAEAAPVPMVAPAAGAEEQPGLSTQVKDLITQEVNDEIALENEEVDLLANGKDIDPGSSGLGRVFGDGKQHVFVVGAPVDVLDEATENECSLSEGDVIQTTEAPEGEEDSASLKVLAAKRGEHECGAEAMVTVKLADLQEMQNDMRAEIDASLDELQQKQGTENIPALPASAQGAAKTAEYAPIGPPPDPNGEAEVTKQDGGADASEQEVMQQEQKEEQAPAPIERKEPDPKE